MRPQGATNILMFGLYCDFGIKKQDARKRGSLHWAPRVESSKETLHNINKMSIYAVCLIVAALPMGESFLERVL